MNITLKSIMTFALCLLFLSSGKAEIKLSSFFSDHMVVQKDRPVRVWGTAMPGEMIRISLSNRVTIAIADENGKWLGTMAPIAGVGPFELKIRGLEEALVFEDVLVGHVWFCLGQSNLEFQVKKMPNNNQMASTANLPNIRLFQMPKSMSATPQYEVYEGQWDVCNAETVWDFSALSFLFGKSLFEEDNLPIGLIQVSWGGTGIATWMPPQALEDHPDYTEDIALLPSLDVTQIQDSINQTIQDWEDAIDPNDLGLANDWHQSNFPWEEEWPTMNLPRHWEVGGLPNIDGAVWFKKKFVIPAGVSQNDVLLFIGKIDDSDQTYINGTLVGASGPNPGLYREYTIPAYLLQPGENIITVRAVDYGYVGGLLGGSAQMKIQQGAYELSLTGEWHYHLGTIALPSKPPLFTPNNLPSLIFNGMVHPLCGMSMKGMIWYQGESDTGPQCYEYRDLFGRLIDNYRIHWSFGNFPFLFVQLPKFHQTASQPGESSWATLRESQTIVLNRPKTGMAVTIDTGDPYNIHPYNKEIVVERLINEAKKLAYLMPATSSPYIKSSQVNESLIIIKFKNVGTGLQSSQENIPGFAIAGEDGVFQWADAQIISFDQIAVSHPNIALPSYVRYGWSDNPGILTLQNSFGLPAGPFRTDFLATPWE